MKITFLYTPPAPSQPQDAVPAAPLVLLHGWGLDSRVWDALLPHLIEQAPQLPLLAVDLPGYRGTSYVAEDAQAVARALAEKLPAGCTLAGWSLGGMLAQLAALQAQSAMARLVLIGTTPSFIQREGFAAAQPPALLTAFAAGVRALPASVVSRFAALSNQGDSCARSIHRQLQALTQEPVPEQAALLASLDWLQTLDLRAQASAITLPALLIHGGQDGLMPLAAGQWLAEHLPNATLLTFPDAAHAPFLHDPARCAAAISRFACAEL